MNLEEYSRIDATGLARLVADGEITAKELALLALESIEQTNGSLNAVIETFDQRATDEWLESLPRGPFHGVPILNKDLSCSEKGVVEEFGSQLARGMLAKEDSTVFTRFRSAGFNNLGRTTTPEFGLVGVTESRISGVTRNPWNVGCTPGGSSGGSAAAVAAGVVPVATASDAGGSIRGPASHCGLVGLKPSRGRIPAGPNRAESNCGLGVSFALTRSVRDCAALLDALAGPALGDPYGIQAPERNFLDEVGAPLKPLKIAYTTASWSDTATTCDVKTAVTNTLKILEDQGHMVEEACPNFDVESFQSATIDVWSTGVAQSVNRLSQLLAREPSLENLQFSTWAMLQRGRQLSATDLLDALSVFNQVNRSVGEFFNKYDLLLLPTCPEPAPEIGAVVCDPPQSTDFEEWNRSVYANDSFTPLFNTTGQPAISLPLYISSDGRPIGVQLVAPFAQESLLLRVSSLLESILPWHVRIPPVHVAHYKQRNR